MLDMMQKANYASIVLSILDIGIQERFVNFCGEGDIYEINSMNIDNYPVFWVACTEPIVERENYIEYPLTLYYIDREKLQNNDRGDTDGILIHSNGVEILSNIIKKIKEMFSDVLVNEINEIQYTLWSDTEIFSDKTNGVYCSIRLALPKETTCYVE